MSGWHCCRLVITPSYLRLMQYYRGFHISEATAVLSIVSSAGDVGLAVLSHYSQRLTVQLVLWLVTYCPVIFQSWSLSGSWEQEQSPDSISNVMVGSSWWEKAVSTVIPCFKDSLGLDNWIGS